MFFVFFVFIFALCQSQADLPVAPPGPPPVLCGEIPEAIYECIQAPNVMGRIRECKTDSLCEGVKCAFRQAGWLVGEKVEKQKISEYFEHIAKNRTEWTQAVQYVKDTCLASDLPVQGVYVNCPAYDIMHCALTAFIRKALPSQWLTTQKCAYPRQYAASCPVCPSECFAPQIPYGSCNACRQLPRIPQTP